MLYVAHFSLAANTLDSAPSVAQINPFGRFVSSVEIAFPSTTNYKVGVHLLDHQSQFAPAVGSPSKWILGDLATVKWGDEIFELTGPPYVLTLEAYNTNGAGGPLEVDVRVEIVSRLVQIEMADRLALVAERLGELLHVPLPV
jgi:hypothetical protein